MRLTKEQLLDREKNGYYLSEATREVDFIYGAYNHIHAPTGSGKTTYVAKGLIEDLDKQFGEKEGVTILLAPYNMLEDQVEQEGLFDKIEDIRMWAMNGFKPLFHKGYTQDEIKAMRTGGKVVMTPHRFFRWIERDDSFLEHVKLVIFDESDHTFCRLKQWEETNNAKRDEKDKVTIFERAVETTKSFMNDIMVVGISATGKGRLYYEFLDKFNNITFKEKLKRYVPKSVDDYSNLKLAFNEAEKYGGKIGIYVESVTAMLGYREYFEGLGYTVDMITSDYAKNYDMTKRERDIKAELSKKEGKSDKISDILLFNASMERGVSIKDKRFHSVIIHSSNPDVVTQVQGRYRFNGMRVWKLLPADERIRESRTGAVVDKNGRLTLDIDLDEKWLNTPLSTDMKDELIEELEFAEGWTNLKKRLEENGYNTKDKRITIKDRKPTFTTITRVA